MVRRHRRSQYKEEVVYAGSYMGLVRAHIVNGRC